MVCFHLCGVFSSVWCVLICAVCFHLWFASSCDVYILFEFMFHCSMFCCLVDNINYVSLVYLNIVQCTILIETKLRWKSS